MRTARNGLKGLRLSLFLFLGLAVYTFLTASIFRPNGRDLQLATPTEFGAGKGSDIRALVSPHALTLTLHSLPYVVSLCDYAFGRCHLRGYGSFTLFT